MEHAEHLFLMARATAAGRKKLTLLRDQMDKCFGERAGDLYRRAHIILNAAHPNGGPDDGAGCAAVADEMAEAFSAKVTTLPHCEPIRDEYAPELLSAISHGFGSATAELAHRI
jgi:hypothetical protein